MEKTKKTKKTKRPLPKFFRVFDWQYMFHDFAKLTGWLHVLFLFRLKSHFISKLAKKESKKLEPFVIISNHHNFSDAIAVLNHFWYRRVPMLIQNGAQKHKAAIFLQWFKCVFVNRENVAYKTFTQCFEILDRGHCLGIFPEGHFVHTEELESFKDGASLIAWKKNVRIIPVFVPLRKAVRNRQHLVIGEPISPREIVTDAHPSVEDFHKITLACEAKMKELKDFYEARKGEQNGKEPN